MFQDLLHDLKQRPQAPFYEPVEKLQNDDQIITQENHPKRDWCKTKGFYPSFVGQTWGEMKKREANRNNTDFFTSNDLEENLKTLYTSLNGKPTTYSSSDNYDSRLKSWQSNPTTALNLYLLKHYPPFLPSNVHSVVIDSGIPISFESNKSLYAIKVKTVRFTLPVMPYVQVLYLVPHLQASYDFSGWNNLRILIIEDNHGSQNYKIKLPSGLLSFSFISITGENINGTFGSTFNDISHNTSVFNSLKHLYLRGIQWPSLPNLSSCTYLNLACCHKIKTVETPTCRVLSVEECRLFQGFGPKTLINNYDLDTVVLRNDFYIYPMPKKAFDFPPGSPFGYRHINFYRFPISSLPSRFVPFAFVSIFDSGSYLYINNPNVRENMSFFFDHMEMLHWGQKKIKSNIPRQEETIQGVINRKYGFNWSKFIKKIQRQYQFKKYIKHTHKSLLKFIPDVLCKHEIAKLFGAIQTFKRKEHDNDNSNKDDNISLKRQRIV